MSDYKRIELFTELAPADLLAPFDPVSISTVPAADSTIDAYLGDAGNSVTIWRYERAMPTHPRFPFVLVSIDHQLSSSTPDELALLCAELAVSYVRHPGVEGGLLADPDECRFMTWERGEPATVNAHPYVASTAFGPAVVAALGRAGVDWRFEDLGVDFEPRAAFLIRNRQRPFIETLWSAWVVDAEPFAADLARLAPLAGGRPTGIERVGYEEFLVDRDAFVAFVSEILGRAGGDANLVAEHRATIIRVVAMALAAGFEPVTTDPLAIGLVAEARLLD